MKKTIDYPVYQRTLACGTLTVQPTGGTTPLDELFDIAERRNPKRAFLFVSKVIGRHIPVSPRVMRSVHRQLAQQFPTKLESPVLFIGMAETAVGLGAGVFDELRDRFSNSVYLTSTRHSITGELLCKFKENHSHATDHLLYLPNNVELRQRVLQAKTVVLIDDEATTGNTFINLLAALCRPNKSEGKSLNQLKQVITMTLTDWSGSAIREKCPLPVQTISLVQGDWHWQSNPDAAIPIMPAVNIATSDNFPIIGKQSWGRVGMSTPAGDLGLHISTFSGEKLLVLGSGEFVWEPFLLAERLENNGAEVKYSSTTRSPISTSFAIESVIAFTDNYGFGIPNYLYNVAHQYFDRILLCVETAANSVDPLLLSALSKIAPIVEVICYE